MLQTTPPPKRFEGPAEGRGDSMSDGDKAANMHLAGELVKLLNPLTNRPRVLDVGAKYPYLMHCINKIHPKASTLAIDGIDEVTEFGAALGVDVRQLNIETEWDRCQLRGKFDLITLVHCIEHFYNPVEIMSYLRDLLYNDGQIFIRCPLSDVSGFERHMSEHHYTIHPSFFCSSAIHELADKLNMVVTCETPFDGCGQGDFVLSKKTVLGEIIGVGMIVKNEERDLPEALESIERFADKILIVDTGSTDATESVVRAFAKKHRRPFVQTADDIPAFGVAFVTYTGASELVEGDWSLLNFAKARNHFVEALDSQCDWLMWVDADDIVGTPERVRDLIAKPFDAFNFSMVDRFDAPTTRFNHMRLWRTGLGVKFAGACHEYPCLPDNTRATHSGIDIMHRWDIQTTGEVSTTRNLRILEREYNDGQRDSRTLFYLANSFRDCQRFIEAAKIYEEYFDIGGGWHDEKIYALVYWSRCLRWQGRNREATQIAFRGLALDDRFSELWMELAYSYIELGSEKVVAACMAAIQPPAQTALFIELNKYQDQPWRVLSLWYEKNGQIESAANATRQILKYVPDDVDMKNQLERFTDAQKNEIHINRPGAVGDILCVLQTIPSLKRKQPGSSVVLHCHPMYHDLARCSPDIDRVESHEILPAGTINLIGYPIAAGWPNVKMTKHLSAYFADELGIDPSAAQMVPLKMNLPPNPAIGRRYVTIHTTAGWSPYKEWPIDRWQAIADHLTINHELRVIQIGGPNDQRLEGVEHRLDPSFPESLAILKGASLHLGIDSWTNHATQVYPVTPAIILFGSTHPDEFGYLGNRNVCRRLDCQPCHREYPAMTRAPLAPCPYDKDGTWTNAHHKCMTDIDVELVAAMIDRKLDEIL